jgi:hypothetical protein
MNLRWLWLDHIPLELEVPKVGVPWASVALARA